jgi:lipid A 3-O-deacylase
MAGHRRDARATEGDAMIIKTFTKRAAAVALIIGFAGSAEAQVTFGSPNDPSSIAVGAGAFNINPSNHRFSVTSAQLQGEYRFGDVLWIVAPFVGLMGTSAGGFYGYGGFGFDVNFGAKWVVTPTFAGGYYYRGGGTDLGSWWEFRSGAEFDYRFENRSRLGVAFYHMSNAGLGKSNHGEQALLLVYSVPLH